ncbi:sugar ABC transporter ATP-binding protein [Ammoniphilus resinae]|uniref:Ribose transport system ATP-binding protein n=1 Tax=Ammoniphilus resinae TaxID=861532 RepID=A0ABS4GSU9_9BACL|nr:sugar ABC transporter ATP-binding protein [Ammoniphilus resinae]MBP1933309.1 ribose transport system ATP-binding protein [Ammoniphilus resinae]
MSTNRMENAESSVPVLELKNISKSFPGVKALDNVSLTLNKGEVLALMGENGAGKSTLIKIITGVYTPDEGSILLNGQNVSFSNPHEPIHQGINVVHQERNLVPTFTVAENILLERITKKSFSVIDKNQLFKDAQQYIDMVGLNVSPETNVETLSAGQKQLIEIAKALSSNAKIMLLDEPTASISLKEANKLIDTVRELQKQGVSFIYVSHKLEEIFQIASSVTVLRDGKNAGPKSSIKDLNRDSLISMMVGRKENKLSFPIKEMKNDSEIVLKVKDLRSNESYKKKSFQLAKGEILGWYGLVGSGRTELARVLTGIDPATSGDIEIKGKKVNINSVSDALNKHKIAYISENRKEEGLFLMHPIFNNVAASIWNRIRNRFFTLSMNTEKMIAEEYKSKLEIKTPSVLQIVGNLSGGNQQKVSIAKGLSTEPEILIFDEPTVGIDVKTKAEIHQLIWDLAESGKSVIVISSDMPEIIQLVDRILVFRNEEISGDIINNKNYDVMSKEIMENIIGGGEQKIS